MADFAGVADTDRGGSRGDGESNWSARKSSPSVWALAGRVRPAVVTDAS